MLPWENQGVKVKPVMPGGGLEAPAPAWVPGGLAGSDKTPVAADRYQEEKQGGQNLIRKVFRGHAIASRANRPP